VNTAFLTALPGGLRTPMDGLHGAPVREVGGWRVAQYPARAADVYAADVSQLPKFELRAPVDEVDAAVAAGMLRLTPTRALAFAPVDGALDLTCAYAAVRLSGPRVRELFGRLSALDVRPKSFRPGEVLMGSVARCPAIVVNEAEDRLLVLVGWEYGGYLWETVLDAGEPLGLAPRTEEVVL
jgi:hypothetical protein